VTPPYEESRILVSSAERKFCTGLCSSVVAPNGRLCAAFRKRPITRWPHPRGMPAGKELSRRELLSFLRTRQRQHPRNRYDATASRAIAAPVSGWEHFLRARRYRGFRGPFSSIECAPPDGLH